MCAKDTCESGLILVFRCYENLGVARIPIQKVAIAMSNQPLKPFSPQKTEESGPF